MIAISRAAGAITGASGRFERASQRLLEAASGAGTSDDMATPMVDMMKAKTEFKAAIAVVKFSDAMMEALLNMQSKPRR